MSFVAQEIRGQEGMVRGLFAGRDLRAPASTAAFPGIRGVAIMPKQFDDAESARAWLQGVVERGGNAIAVKIGVDRWLIGADVENHSDGGKQ